MGFQPRRTPWDVVLADWPALLVHTSSYAVVADGLTCSLPWVGRAPLQPPDAVQPVALLACQFRLALSPRRMRLGVAPKLAMVGAPGGVPRTITRVDALALSPCAFWQSRL